jgi:hypothetical protein
VGIRCVTKLRGSRLVTSDRPSVLVDVVAQIAPEAGLPGPRLSPVSRAKGLDAGVRRIGAGVTIGVLRSPAAG